ncbi:MAG: DMT family transporter [Proteobacteria bacterium]|nr:DMT family transporter [Pseudomonadota bacterium]
MSGLIGVIIFSGSLPATRVAVSGFSPLFLTSARAVIAALLAVLLLIALRQRKPARGELLSLGIVAAGVVIGFPLLTALALQHITSAHSIVFIGLLPLATAIFAVVRGGERPKPLFWLFSIIGSATVAGFAFGHDSGASPIGDILMICAIIVCGLGYAEGAKLARQYGGWQVISWALVFAAPAMLLIAIATLPTSWANIDPAAWAGLAYVSIFSMLVGFIFWYRGLAIGGTASVGQLQLLQPFLGLAFAGLVLHEPVAWTMIAATGVVVVCVMLARRFA